MTSPHMTPDVSSEFRSLASGVRAVALVFTLILSYFNVRLALQVDTFESIFVDMLGDKPLPGITDLVLHGRPVLIILSIVIPVSAVVIVARVRNHKAALYALAGLMIATFIQTHLTWTGLFAPLMSIINAMRE